MEWDFDSEPPEEGWYAVMYSWDPDEGSFPGAWYWTGRQWQSSIPPVAFAGPFEYEHMARLWAEKHDWE